MKHESIRYVKHNLSRAKNNFADYSSVFKSYWIYLFHSCWLWYTVYVQTNKTDALDIFSPHFFHWRGKKKNLAKKKQTFKTWFKFPSIKILVLEVILKTPELP